MSEGLLYQQVYRRHDKMTEEGVHKIGVLSTLSHHCASRIDALSVHLSENSVENFDNFIEGCENLDQGEIDLFVAPSNLIWDEREILATKGLSIVAALQRNHPFHVLVSSDDPWHLKADAIVLCDEKIIERQLLRRERKIYAGWILEIILNLI